MIFDLVKIASVFDLGFSWFSKMDKNMELTIKTDIITFNVCS
jgi:hypothetical protein